MKDVNKVFLTGKLGKDPVVKQLQRGKRGSFQLATTESWKDKQGEWQSKTTWSIIVVWGAMCDAIENLEKGQQVLVEGKIGTRIYEEKTITEVTAHVIMPFTKKEKKVEEKEKKEEEEYPEDSLPF